MAAETKEFVGYEYRDIIVKNKYVDLYEDSYENFGWKLEGTGLHPHNVGQTTMKFKRNRKLKGKQETIKLQRKFDEIVRDIDYLERNKSFLASALAYGIGITATMFMAASVFALTVWNNHTAMIILAIPAFIGWVVPYPVFVDVKKNKTQELTPLVDAKYDELYDLTKSANEILKESE